MGHFTAVSVWTTQCQGVQIPPVATPSHSRRCRKSLFTEISAVAFISKSMEGITQDLYVAHGAANVPVFGNPTLSTNPFFKIAIEHDLDPFQVQRHLKLGISDKDSENKLWTSCRFGQTCTELPDGRKIYIAGEHEDLCVSTTFKSNLLIYLYSSQLR